jgi:hypothetical protein
MRQTVGGKIDIMPAPDRVIREILECTKSPSGELDPWEATAQLTACYPNSWVDKGQCAAHDIENYKRRHAFKPDSEGPEDYYAIVVLSEGKERIWVFRGEMQRHHVLMRIKLISRKNREHNQATKTEVKYWHDQNI